MGVRRGGDLDKSGRRADVIVAGGGLAGLTAAAYLAKARRRVIVFEKAGLHFNLGAHALYRAGRGGSVSRELGMSVEGRNTAPGRRLCLARRRSAHAPHRLRVPAHDRAFDRAGEGRGRPTAGAMGISRREGSPAGVSGRLAATYTDDPERLSAGAALDQIRLGGKGVLYLNGGWQTLVDQTSTTKAVSTASTPSSPPRSSRPSRGPMGTTPPEAPLATPWLPSPGDGVADTMGPGFARRLRRRSRPLTSERRAAARVPPGGPGCLR
ncbi:MAG: FAD-binding protein [Vicinamibacteria bacterium]|nr:FAD-binding protein [Vicinamibacteria bacterium]